jgi:hypothetical protein
MIKTTSTNGTSSGRPEMFLNGRWYNFYDALSTQASTVVCRQLGFSGTTGASGSAGTCGNAASCGTLSPVTCTSQEALVADCSYLTYPSDYTGYSVACTAP